jgi:aryl-alcohol dehydrogenase (NADP+)
MGFGAGADEETSIKIVRHALDAGINFIDTADVYGRGVSEEIVGKAISSTGARDRIVLATKAVASMGDGPNDSGASRYHLTHACEESLRRLRTDRIDLYYLHVVDLTTPLDEILDTLHTLVQQGKILYVGTSKWPASLIVEAIGLSERHGLPRIVAEQPPYNILDRTVESELVWTCRRHGVGLVTFSPLAGGILAGKYRKGAKPSPGSRFEGAGPDHRRLTPAALDAVEELRSLAQARGCSLAELAHAWLEQQPGMTAAIAGPKTVEHLQAAIKGSELTLNEEELALIDRIVPSGKSVSDFYDGVVYARMRDLWYPTPAKGATTNPRRIPE